MPRNLSMLLCEVGQQLCLLQDGFLMHHSRLWMQSGKDVFVLGTCTVAAPVLGFLLFNPAIRFRYGTHK